MSFPGPQKNKMEYFVHKLYEGGGGKELSKQQIMKEVEPFPFASDTQVFFEEIPDQSYDERGLVDALNRVIEQRGREDAIGGKLEALKEIPPEWDEAFEKEYQKR